MAIKKLRSVNTKYYVHCTPVHVCVCISPHTLYRFVFLTQFNFRFGITENAKASTARQNQQACTFGRNQPAGDNICNEKFASQFSRLQSLQLHTIYGFSSRPVECRLHLAHFISTSLFSFKLISPMKYALKCFFCLFFRFLWVDQ